MRSYGLEITLESDCIFTADPASTNAETLLFVPGASLLGAAARRLYGAFEKEDLAFDVFHSGKVRFGSAHPAANGAITWPCPFSWHHPKGAEWTTRAGSTGGGVETRVLVDSVVHDRCQYTVEDWRSLIRNGVQLQAARSTPWKPGATTEKGLIAIPRVRESLKTALDSRKTLRPMESMLFVYEALERGGTYLGTLDIDDDLPDTIDGRILEALTSPGVRLGRSRSAEYGRVSIRAVDAPRMPTPDSFSFDGKSVHFLCLSDLALTTPTGGASFVPRSREVGLPDGARWIPERSTLQVRQYIPFNGKRRSPTLGRQVIAAGSVLTFDVQDLPVDLEQVNRHLERGIGVHRQDGLGRICCQPGLLTTQNPSTRSASQGIRSVSGASSPGWPAGAIGGWLARQNARIAVQKDLVRDVEDRASRIVRAQRGAVCPGKSQWGEVRTKARASSTVEELQERLFAENTGYCTHGSRATAWRVLEEGSPGKLLQQFIEVLKNGESTRGHEPEGVYLLATAMEKRLRRLRKDRP